MTGNAELDIAGLSTIFNALSSPVRLKILQLVGETKKPLHIKAVARTLQADYATIYRHVDVLKKAGVVQIFEVGRSRVLSIQHEDALAQLFTIAEQIKHK